MTVPESKTSSHPKYNEMIATAIEVLKEKGGSSRLAILKYISAQYNVVDNPKLVNRQLKIALKKGVVSGSLIQVKGTGASGSFKLNKLKAAAKPRKAALEVSKVIKPNTAISLKKPATKVFKPKSVKSLKTSIKKANKKLVTPKTAKFPQKSTNKKSVTPKAAESPKKSTKKPKSPRKPVKKPAKK